MPKPLTYYCTVTEKPGPHDDGKTQFCMEWTDPDGRWEPAPSDDGKPVGYRHGQYFRTNLEEHVKRLRDGGNTVIFGSPPATA
jgi:hypothetical protein